MTEHNPTSPIEKKPAPRPLRCDEWEALLADAIDGTLVTADSAAFQAHSESCKACAVTLEETKKGQEWLQFLHTDPTVPADLLGRILARTSGAAGTSVLVAGEAVPDPVLVIPPPLWKRMPAHASIPALFRRVGEPRMMMTAAMAFFSIALTLNLMGVRVSSVRLADLKPNVLQTNIRRSYISANARVSRYYDNLRIVYEVESRMREMQRTSEEDQPAAPKQNDKKINPDGSAGKTPAPGGKSQSPRNGKSRAYLSGRMELARLRTNATAIETLTGIVSPTRSVYRRRREADSKERSWA